MLVHQQRRPHAGRQGQERGRHVQDVAFHLLARKSERLDAHSGVPPLRGGLELLVGGFRQRLERGAESVVVAHLGDGRQPGWVQHPVHQAAQHAALRSRAFGRDEKGPLGTKRVEDVLAQPQAGLPPESLGHLVDLARAVRRRAQDVEQLAGVEREDHEIGLTGRQRRQGFRIERRLVEQPEHAASRRRCDDMVDAFDGFAPEASHVGDPLNAVQTDGLGIPRHLGQG